MGLLDPETSDGRIIFFLPWERYTIAGRIIFFLPWERYTIAVYHTISFRYY
jgi:hypothetical protein